MTLRSVPFSRRFVVSDDAGRNARRVRMLAGTSDWRRDVLDRVASAAILIGGTRPWPISTGWQWPATAAAQVESQLTAAMPGVRIEAAVMPRQAGRARLSLLCRSGGRSDQVIVVKLALVDDGLERETLALELLTDKPLPAIATPRVLASGQLDDDIMFLATDAIGLDRQRPAIDEPLRHFEHDLAERLAGLPRPPDIASDAVPIHGDLAPWNLRRTGRGLALFDWESAGWGAPGSDLDFYRRSCGELRR